ncbi:olfactory receptor 14A16-like [Tachyglossus aculeatus]|uniref:olfactory receptor 14A16-like n=1 Tax=Tachyglossus aculeatus TaxID=9261 RepID=UPI0018F71C6D|nr:olfactory receptor 14A16-like [Tachyglossus aculeatus]
MALDNLKAVREFLLLVFSEVRKRRVAQAALFLLVIMSRGVLWKTAAASWLSGGLSGLMYAAATFFSPFCGSNAVHQFFCDVSQLLTLSDPSVIIREVGVTISGVSLAFLRLASIVVSYVHIFRAVLRMPFYAVVPPAVNPLIYSLRNKNMKNLSVLELCYVSVPVPKSIHNSLTDQRSICYWSCVAHVFLVVLFARSFREQREQIFLLKSMSYDRYAAICLPLRNGVIMEGGASGTFSSSFCRLHEVQQFFCDARFLLKCSCSGSHVVIDTNVAVVLDLLVSMSYSPILNPLIYSLRNLDMKASLGRHPGLCQQPRTGMFGAMYRVGTVSLGFCGLHEV